MRYEDRIPWYRAFLGAFYMICGVACMMAGIFGLVGVAFGIGFLLGAHPYWAAAGLIIGGLTVAIIAFASVTKLMELVH